MKKKVHMNDIINDETNAIVRLVEEMFFPLALQENSLFEQVEEVVLRVWDYAYDKGREDYADEVDDDRSIQKTYHMLNLYER